MSPVNGGCEEMGIKKLMSKVLGMLYPKDSVCACVCV